MKLFGLFHSGNPRAAWRATGGAACALWDAHAMRAHDTAGEGTLFAFSSGSCAQEALDAEGLSHIHICPETMGKINQ